MSLNVKIHLFGSEKNGWALNTDLALTQRSLQQIDGLIHLTSFEEADVIHSVWEEPLFQIDPNRLTGKRIICHVCNNLMRLHENPAMIKAEETVGLWVAMSQEAAQDLRNINRPFMSVPYSVDTKVFTPSASSFAAKSAFGLPEETFVISNFMRDSFGHNLNCPKDQKGVELLLELGLFLKRKNIPVHFLLAGPRRHWIRSQLRQHSLPFTFVGKETDRDDLDVNTSSADIVNSLYNASDLHLITSRWEGGPRSVLEAAAAGTPVLCTPVGIAPDILMPESLFSSFDEAAAKIEAHYRYRQLDATVQPQRQTVLAKHTPEANAPLFEKLYRNIEAVPPYKPVRQPMPVMTMTRKILAKLRGSSRPLRISLWHEFHAPPYGGGNQFMLSLQDALEKQGVDVLVNKFSNSIDAHICNSCWFDHKKFERKASSSPVKIIHRIDGPVTLYREKGRDEDEKIFALNQRFASATVFQSAYSFKQCCALGFRPVAPVIIHNSVNRTIFDKAGQSPFADGRKIRLISSAWSDNPNKGGMMMKWLDMHLDWDRFEYTFVGRVQEKFSNIRHIQPLPSKELAEQLHQHDIYLALSQHEPCSNALIEALACGLPTLYRDDGGNPELVSFGGLPFSGQEDVLVQLGRLAEHLVSFQRLIWIKNMEDVASKYINLAKRLRNC